MITSSQFFNKSIHSFEPLDSRMNNDGLSPWNQEILPSDYDTYPHKTKNNDGVHELSKISSKKYIEKRIKRYNNNKNYLPDLKEKCKFISIE